VQRGRPPGAVRCATRGRLAGRAVPVAAALALLAAGGWAADRATTASPPRASAVATGSTAPAPAPALAGPTLAGGVLDLRSMRDSVVVVNVWAAWCAPCRSELPVLVAARRRLGGQGMRLVGLDVRDGERQARALLEQVGGDPAASVTDPSGRLAGRWGVRGVPETFVVDARGLVRARHVGAVTAAWMDEHVVPLLPATG
jgi:cytochrome c biogenesis protein CcmG, thiol:disulfide interchange protein DsbE